MTPEIRSADVSDDRNRKRMVKTFVRRYVTSHRKSELLVMLNAEGNEREVWVPYSLIDDNSNTDKARNRPNKNDDSSAIYYLPWWFAEKEELLYEEE